MPLQSPPEKRIDAAVSAIHSALSCLDMHKQGGYRQIRPALKRGTQRRLPTSSAWFDRMDFTTPCGSKTNFFATPLSKSL
jgi:hypothetical protein